MFKIFHIRFVAELSYLPDIWAFGFSRPGDDARHRQARLAGVDKVRRVHLSTQGLDVLQNGHFYLKSPQKTALITLSTHHYPLYSIKNQGFLIFNSPWGLASESDPRWTSSECWTVGRTGKTPWHTKRSHVYLLILYLYFILSYKLIADDFITH